MRTLVAVGFGDAHISKDGEVVYREPKEYKKIRTLLAFERMATKDPDHDWRMVLDAPLRSQEYQRQGPKRWVLVKSGMGFA